MGASGLLGQDERGVVVSLGVVTLIVRCRGFVLMVVIVPGVNE